MKYISTRGQSPPLAASEAILQGLAPDGGLYVPEKWPKPKTQEELRDLDALDFPNFSVETLKPFFTGDLLQSHLSKIVTSAFAFPLVMKQLEEETSLLELFHGPTNAFKDFGARFLALSTNELKKADISRERLVMVATSGDTGGAVAAAFTQCSEIKVVILYPHMMISPRQEKQLTSWGPQARAFSVVGSFDDCQRLVKQAFLSPKWNLKYELISANSINLARLLPQMCYFAFASLQYQKKYKRTAGFIVPSGNLGNSVAALWAKRSGFPISKVICSQNANRAVANYFVDHKWRPLPTVLTLANAMDVGNPSNFERMQKMPDLLKDGAADSVSDLEIQESILKVKSRFGEIVCPHTATAFRVREKLKTGDWIIVSTAHPAKFEEIVEPLVGHKVDVPKSLQDILKKQTESRTIQADLDELEKILLC